MLSVMTSNALLQITDEEGATLASAIQRVSRHYDIPGISAETLDWIGLIQCIGAIYGTRFIASRLEARAAAARDVTPKDDPLQAAPPNTRQPTPPDNVEVPGFGGIKLDMRGQR